MTAKSYGLTVARLHLLCLLSFSLALESAASPKLMLVEVWCGGDDALTTTLRDTIGQACCSKLALQTDKNIFEVVSERWGLWL
jgi:hypothetical protein